jgi:predicted amidohydrolase YtcJ
VAGDLDRWRLDALRADVPVRVQHRSGAAWTVNSAGARRLGLDAGGGAPGVERDRAGRATGRLLRCDGWLRERLGPAPPPDLAPVGRLLAAAGVTGVTDATPSNGAAELRLFAEAQAAGALPQRVLAMGGAALPDPASAGLARGPVKLVPDDAALPLPEALAERIADAHAAGRAAAVHCVTRAELALTLCAFRLAGVRRGDRLEHAAVAPPELVAQVAALGLTVVTQPGLVAERGEVWTREVEPRDRAWLWRVRAWRAAGVPLAAGTDAPFGAPDPWRATRAAVLRRDGEGRALGPDERLAPECALALFLAPLEAPGGAPRRVRPGAPADLCLLDRPWAAARRLLARELVAATFRAGVRVGP